MSLGPRSYAEIFDWPAKGLESIAAACKCRGRDAMAYLQGLMSCSAEIVLTTHFSGMGTSEMALAMIEDMLQQHGISLPMRVHSATDFNQDCRKVLMSYQPPHGPEHVFGDILDRLPEQAKDRLIARQLYYKQQFEKASGNGASPHGGVSKRNLAREVGNRFIQETINILLQERGMLCDQAFCYRHECNCPIFPDGLAGHQFHLEIAGSVCTPWSLQGAGLGWLDPASLPFMVWAIQLKKAQPHAFLHECTPSFPVDVLAQIVDEFKVEAATCCPTDFGIPQSRRRVYRKGSHITKVTRVLDYNMTVLQEVFFRVPAIDGTAYFCAPAAEVQAYISEMAQARGIPPHPRGKTYACRDVLCIGDKVRLEGYEDLARTNGYCEGFLVNITQNCWHGSLMRWCPALLRRSTVFSDKENRVLIPREHLAVQGWNIT